MLLQLLWSLCLPICTACVCTHFFIHRTLLIGNKGLVYWSKTSTLPPFLFFLLGNCVPIWEYLLSQRGMLFLKCGMQFYIYLRRFLYIGMHSQYFINKNPNSLRLRDRTEGSCTHASQELYHWPCSLKWMEKEMSKKNSILLKRIEKNNALKFAVLWGNQIDSVIK